MNAFYLILGILLLVFVIVDLLWTILWVEGGAGPMTRYVTQGSWKLLQVLSGKSSRVLSAAGPVILILTLVTWIILIWAGWMFIFASGEASVMDPQNRGPVAWTDVIYFTGFTIFTLGVGDYVPKEGVWQILTTLASANGMLFLTMSASYVVSILSAVTQKRSWADSISGLGKNGEEFVRSSWNGRDFHNINLILATYADQLSTITAQHNAYPVLHYYHSQKASKALVSSLAIFDEGLTIILYGIPEKNQPNYALVKNARSSVGSYMEAMGSNFVKPAEEVPPPPDLKAMREAGLPVVSSQGFEGAVSELDDRRRMLAGFVQEDLREWPSKGD